MNFLTKTLTSLLATVFTSVPVMATPSHFQEHVTLMAAVESVGVRVYVNSAHCDGAAFYGYYRAMGKGTLVICQQNRVTGNQEMVPWTEEDFDTLRHESHHLVQDCKGGVGRGDNVLVPIFKDELGVINFARPILGDRGLQAIAKKYGELGAPWEVILLEFEAFAVSAGISASDIAMAVEYNCPVR